MIGPRNPVSKYIHKVKYRQKGETFDDYCVRYARTTADDEHHFRRLLPALRDQSTLPAGRQQRAVGWPFQTTAMNCYVAGTIKDDTESIGNSLTEAMLTLRSGGGCGWDFSSIRPFGEPVRGLGDDAYASGPVSFMGMWHAMCETIRSAGERRGAMMGGLRVDHPDIMKFVGCKKNSGALTNFNVSVCVTDEFMEAVKNDLLFPLRFEGRVFKTVRALDLWAMIMENTWDWAEPGVLFVDTANRMNPLSYCETLYVTNPCVSGDTEILTEEGYKRIDKLVGRGKVKVWNGEEWSLVEPKVTGYDQLLLEVKTSDGSVVKCTPYHKFLLADGSRVEAKDLDVGDRLIDFDAPVIQRGSSFDRAYQQGFFSGDGCWKGNRAELWLYGEKKELTSYFDYDYINTYIQPDGSSRIEVLLKPGMLQKNFVPSVLWDIKSRLAWFAGLCDADGAAVYTSGKGKGSTSIQISSIDRAFLDNVRKLLMTLGVRSSIRMMKSASMVSFPDKRGGRVAYDCKDCHRLILSSSQVRKLVDLGFSPNRLKLSFVGKRKEIRKAVVIESVEQIGKADKVYCFTESKRHCGVFGTLLLGNCGEQWLPPNGACLLLSQNAVKYLVPSYARDVRGTDGAVTRSRFELDYDRLRHDVEVSVRACDNVFENTVYPLKAQQAEAYAKRRMGIGITGVANTLEVCGYRYGTAEYIAQQDKVLEVIRDVSYTTSIDMARVKGSFPLFDADKWLDSGFAKTLPDEIRDGIRRYGLRNGLLLSIAPTGTISLSADNVSSGIEPPPFIEGSRIIQTSDGPATYQLNDWAYEEHGIRCRTALDCTPEEHVNVLCAAQRYIDNSISKTVNVRGAKQSPAAEGEITFDEFKDVYMKAYDGGAKGCATFNVNGKRMGIISERAASASSKVVEPTCYIDPLTGSKTCG